jgi:hypothetical protein
MIAEAFFLGLMGSLHCLGMCGGFSIAFHRRGPKGLAAYQGGRAIGYVAGGTLCGTLGGGLAFTIGNPGLQAVVGLVFIAFGLGWSPKWNSGGRLLTALAPLIKKPGLSSAAAMGLLTALLPCGLLAAGLDESGRSRKPSGGCGLDVLFLAWYSPVAAVDRVCAPMASSISKTGPLGFGITGLPGAFDSDQGFAASTLCESAWLPTLKRWDLVEEKSANSTTRWG